ncbi:MAG TPA: hypothetical protein VH643_00780 [Gemmataceae bacterium]|jgi:hypothetical protein
MTTAQAESTVQSTETAPAVESNSTTSKREALQWFATVEEAVSALPNVRAKFEEAQAKKVADGGKRSKQQPVICKVSDPHGKDWYCATSYTSNALEARARADGYTSEERNDDGTEKASTRAPGAVKAKVEAAKEEAWMSALPFIPAHQRVQFLVSQGLDTPRAEAIVARMGDRPSGVEASEAATVAKTETAKGKGKGKGAKQS